MTVLIGEIKVVLEVLEKFNTRADKGEEFEAEEVAMAGIEALDEYRSKKPQFANLAVFSDDGGANWYAALMGPYKSRAIAKSKSGGLFPPGSGLSMKWLTMAMPKDFRKEVLAYFKSKGEEVSAWQKDSIPIELLRRVAFMEPIESEDEDE